MGLPHRFFGTVKRLVHPPTTERAIHRVASALTRTQSKSSKTNVAAKKRAVKTRLAFAAARRQTPRLKKRGVIVSRRNISVGGRLNRD